MEAVSIVKCRSWNYEYREVKAALEATFQNLGGLSRFVEPGDRVLLKVNLVMKKDPEAAATSHPVFVEALARMIKEWGGEVIIGDSPGGPFNEMRLRAVYQGCGMKEAAQRSGAALNYDTASSEVQNPRGLILKKLTNLDILRKVDKVINVAKLKTHGMMRMTGAVKNMFGTVPGALKAEYHLNRPEPAQFADALIDICLCANPILSIVDAIVAMEGDGPTSGTPRRVGAVLASQDPFGLDLAAARLIGAEPEGVPTVLRSIERGLCPGDYKMLDYAGAEEGERDRGEPGTAGCAGRAYLEELAVKDFKVPAVRMVNPVKAAPPLLKRAVDRFGQPYPSFIQDRCVKCGECKNGCPPGAISMTEGRLRVDLEKCIRCFCCQELCPQKAVRIRRPWLFRLISKV